MTDNQLIKYPQARPKPVACIIKANTIVIYNVGVVNNATNSGVAIYDASVINTMLASYFFN